MRLLALISAFLPPAFLLLAARGSAQELLSASDVVAMDAPPPDHVIAYGPEPLQYGHLRIPPGDGPFPVVLFLHGGCWLSAYGIGHVGPLENALAQEGYAVWSLEYRRIGDEGGAWPGTFRDAAAGADYLRTLAQTYPLDLDRVVAAGHSAGGHLALWLAARPKLQSDAELHTAAPLPIGGVFAMAPAAALEMLHEAGTCGNAVDGLMGGGPDALPTRYAEGSPMQLVPIDAQQTVFVGNHDHTWAPPARAYYEAAVEAGDEQIELEEAPESGHFEMIAPTSSTWPLVRDALARLFRRMDGRTAPPSGR